MQTTTPTAASQTRSPTTPPRPTPVVTFLPPAVYDVVQALFFPLNYAIGVACHLQPGRSVWDEAESNRALVGSGAPLSEIRERLLAGADKAFDEEDLVRLYDSLPAVSAQDDLVGRTWRGKIVRTGASVLDVADRWVRRLNQRGLEWGKRYRTAHTGDPLLFRYRDRVYVPVPLWGNVGMTDIRWRGVPTATMNYDHQPWKDYFRLLSDDDGTVVLLGVWTHKHIAGGWFTLTLDEGVPTV